MTKKRFQKLLYNFVIQHRDYYEGQVGRTLKALGKIEIIPESATKYKLSYDKLWKSFSNI